MRDLIGSSDIGLAYRVQHRVNEDRIANGAAVVGHKIGLTSPAVQKQLGVNQPDLGVLFSDMCYSEGDKVPIDELLQPKVEAEIAFVLGADLDEEHVDAHRFRGAVDHAVVALEVVDSRIANWDITITDTIADNASCGLFVLGEKTLSIEDFEPANVSMTLAMDGEIVSVGDGKACLGDPLAACAWLATTGRRFGSPLRAGDIVLSGALGPMVGVCAGSRISAEISALGRVSATFA
ncbi:putative hydratase/decarboxylase [Mycobacterium saskatchewanense]|nr:putative hydratase/decarboxylase [Mycobacterium saskatchewanense]